MIEAASSLYHSLKDLELEKRRETQQKVYAVLGLSLKPNKEVGGTAELKSKIIDQTAKTHKLLTLEALHIWMERPRINTRDEFSSRELTLKL